jgi:hypothetical protein
MSNPRDRQVERERASREAALGQRAKAIQEGRLGPVLRRWINADVVPIATLMRELAGRYLAGDMRGVADLLDSPTAELSERERPLKPLMEWLLRGRSPGRADTTDTTHADDLVLAFMAAALLRLARDEQVTLSAFLALAADVLRDTVQGQFISNVQGASAMQRIREQRPEAWKQRKSLNRICARLWAQVKPLLERDARGEVELRVRGGKKVLEVIDQSGELRRLEMRVPDVVDWEVMSLCWRDETSSESSPHRPLWLALSSIFLAAAQRVGGWFELASTRTGRKGHTRTTKYVVLSDRAKEAIRKDVERWTSLGFHAQPMVVEPEGNDYLTVKHRPVTGQRPPRGLLTDPSGTSAWECGAAALASSPWTINTLALGILDAHPELWHPEDPSEAIRVAEHRRLAAEEAFYLPTCMDFRGRIYYRTPWVSPQSGDLGKSLLCFPKGHLGPIWEAQPDALRAIMLHMTGLAGLDKKPYTERKKWWYEFMSGMHEDAPLDKPLTFKANYALMASGQGDRIPIQLDGTCNGLQHLTALTRDPEGARHVNLCPSTLDEAPADIYGHVAETVRARLDILHHTEEWVKRLVIAGMKLDRKLCKSPVMVLPYGGTREAVMKAVKASVLEQLGTSPVSPPGASAYSLLERCPWRGIMVPEGYEAFRDRPLDQHPLFAKDVAQLANLVWDCITPAIPRAMAFMAALQDIGSWVGERALAWQVGTNSGPETPTGSATGYGALWVIQAKSKAARKQVTMRGFHLPDMVRRVTLMANLNEIDPKAHRTGIVANFVHSLDAAHLAASVQAFRRSGGGCVGSVHDCLLVRPSEAALMGRCLREEFVRLHEDNDPLLNPVRVGTLGLDEIIWKEYPDWYALAAEAGVEFPERGDWEPEEVLRSAWFFS